MQETIMKIPALVCALTLCGASAALADTSPGRIVLPTDVRPTHYDIAVIPDAAKLTFAGTVKIDIDVVHPTKTIKLNAADLSFDKVSVSGAKPPTVAYDAAQETATLTFPSTVSAGRHLLTIVYTGKINQHAAGLFALDYDTAQGKKRALFTQFENSDARRFIPSWDEPAIKATFTLTATVPAAEMPLSNTPVASTENLSGGLKRVHFATSPKMSSYLLFFGTGDFERIHQMIDGVDVGVVFKRGDAAKATYALDAASHILPFYEGYFGVKFPLPKLDLIAGPGQSQFFGAMENWGAIFYFETDLLIDPKISTEADKRNVYVVIAHEMAHQWFGDLVTMSWWDDLWLNEGFAEWMESKATDHFHPEWHLWLDALGQKEGAMQTDARAGTHPIIRPILDVLQANEAFDEITYQKGQAVIWMLENDVGADTFRAGVRNYIKKYAYGNTVTDDLWRELDKVSSTPVTTVAHDFTLQAGIPLIRVAKTTNGIELTQDRYTVDGSGDANATWHVPVIEKPIVSGDAWRGIVTRGKPVDIALAGDAVPIVNAGQSGYFRTLYAPDLLSGLVANFRKLDAVDQVGLIHDTKALGYAGYEPLTDFLALASQASPDMDPQALSVIADNLNGLANSARGLPSQKAVNAYVRSVLDPLFARVGWEAQPGENQNVTLLRNSLLGDLSNVDEEAVIAGARTRFATFVKDPQSLSGDLRRNVLQIVAEHADAATWDQIHALAKATNDSLAKQEYYQLLGFARDPALAQKALDLSLTDEAPVTVRPGIIDAVAFDYHPELAVDFVSAHADQVNAMLEPDSRSQYVPRLASASNDPAMIPKLEAYAAAHIPANARQDVEKAKSSITYGAKIRSERIPTLKSWLAAHTN
jgi:aminopeptidase N